MKYEIGDKVIELELDYLSNPYHFKKCIHELTVLDADERYFSPYYEDYDKDLSGSNQWSIFTQGYGIAVYGGKRFYHKFKDADLIKELIEKAFSDYDKMCKNSDEARISELKKIAQSAEDEIHEIRKGNGTWKIGFSRYSNSEYRSKVEAIIKKIFSF